MRSLLFLFLSLIICSNSFSQQVNPFEKFTFDESYTIVGLGTTKTSGRLYHGYNFILKDTASMNALKKSWNFKTPRSFFLQQDYFNIFVLRGKEIKESFSISLELSLISPTKDGEWYQFDNKLLEKLNDRLQPDFHLKTDQFLTNDRAVAFADSLKNNSSCLFVLTPPLIGDFEGTFLLTFPKTDKIPDFKVATSFAAKALKRIAKENEFASFFSWSYYNVAHKDSFQVTVNSSRKIYDELEAVGFRKGRWDRTKFEVSSYWEGRDTVDTLLDNAPPPLTSLVEINGRFNSEMIDVSPRFPGGFNAFRKYLSLAYRRPQAAIEARVSGRLLAQFVIEKDGRITDVEIINDLGYGTGEELKRILLASPNWKPGRHSGRNVRVRYVVPVNLALPPPVQTVSLLPVPKPKLAKMAELNFIAGKYYFEKMITTTCPLTEFVEEDGLQALSDRFSILGYAMKSLPANSLSKIIGRLSYQVVIDSTGKCCAISFKNETNLNDKSVSVIHETIASKSMWNLLPSKNGSRMPVSAMLVFSFTEETAKYQHYNGLSNNTLKEQEYAQKSKSGRKW